MLKKNKKAQLTVFIIVAILIVAIIILFFIFRNKIGLEGEISIDEKEMHDFIEDCVLTGLVDGARLVGLQGGYLETPENAVKLNLSNVAYGYYLGSKTLPSKGKIENEIERYIELTLPYCFNEDNFLEYNIRKGDVKSGVDINKNSISTSTRFSIGATKGDTSFTINKEFNIDVPIKLNEIYDVAEEIIEKEMKNPELIELTYLADLDYEVSIIPYNDNIIIYSIIDENPKDSDYFYVFRFANRLK